MTKGIMINLSNHPAAKWSATQRDAAIALGFDEVIELPSGMPLVPPDADTEDIEQMALRIVDEVADLSASGAHVAGEPSLSFALVRLLQVRGLPCYAATTERKVNEQIMPDGSVTKTQIFRFIKWRMYSSRF